MRKSIPIPVKNKGVAESLLYSLQIKFHDARFSLAADMSELSVDCSDEEVMADIGRSIGEFLGGISEMVGKVSTKNIRSFEGKRRLRGVLPASSLVPSALSGVYVATAEMSETITALDAVFLRYAARYRALPVDLPSLIGAGELETAGYLPKDAHQVGRISTFDSADHAACLSPAGCLPLYPMLARAKSPLPPSAFTAMCRVFRYEGGRFDQEDPCARLWEFRVREIIFLDGEVNCRTRRAEFIDFMSLILKHLDISFEICTAADMFISPEYAKQTFFQLLKGTKIECRIVSEGGSISVASFNDHAGHFVSKFNIPTKSDGLGTFCVGFGMERLAGIVIRAYPDRAEREIAIGGLFSLVA